MHVIAISNLKGGSSKSTTTFNLAGTLAEAGYRVLCIDIDPQRTLGEAFFGVYSTDMGLSNTLVEDGLLGPLAQPTEFENLQIIPADDGLKSIKSGQTRIEGSELRLRSCLSRVEAQIDRANNIHAVDWVLIDCPPSLDRLTMNALVACDYVFIPVDAGAGGRGALGETMEYIRSARKWYNPTLKLLGLLISNTDLHTVYDQTAVAVVRELYGDSVFKTVIAASVRVRESAESRTPLVFCKGSEFKRYADMYRELKDEVVNRVNRDVSG